MKIWTNDLNRGFYQRSKSNYSKTHEEILNIPGHKGIANQNHIKIPPHLLERNKQLWKDSFPR
jgi:hypothetical protein